VTYTYQNYTKAALVDGDGIDTGEVDPRTVNWLYELTVDEGTRLSQGLFGVDGLDLFHVVTHPDWYKEFKASPALVWRFSRRVKSEVGNRRMDYYHHEYTGLGGSEKIFTTRYPQLSDLTVELHLVLGDESPPFDAEQKLENLCGILETTVNNETIQLIVDDPMIERWRPSRSNLTVSTMTIEYRYVPVVWYDYLEFGAVIEEVTQRILDKKAKDDHDIDEVLDTLVVT
jgi:hypothetical protein